jgi:hypothetical protein
MDVVALNSSRTTFQRISDAKFFSGWIKSINPHVVVAHTCTNSQPQTGEEFAFQVYGNSKDAFFHGKLVALHGAENAVFSSDRSGSAISAFELSCEITTEMVFKDSRGQPRFCVEGITADIRAGDELKTDSGVVIDIGPGGFAVLSEAKLKKGEIVQVALYARGQLVRCDGEIRSCVTNSLNAAFSRVGVQIKRMERIDSLRWKQLYSSVLESNRVQGLLTSAEVGTVVKLRSRAA